MGTLKKFPGEKCPSKDDEASLQDEKSANPRGNWGRQIEFTLSCIGYAVGLGNLWRFPYLCMRNGGGAFLIPYFSFLILCGIPLYFMELCLGQFSSLSPLSVWRLCPLFKGIGWGMIIVSAIMSIYYNVIIAWILYFLGMSLQREVPWKTCDNYWNTAACKVIGGGNVTVTNVTETVTSNVSLPSRSPAEEFWNYKVLDLSDGIENLGPIKWDLLLSLIAAWILIFLCLCKGVKSSGKVVYVTATMPYLLLTVLLIRGATLPGSLEGIKYYIIPDFERLKYFNVWTEACLQIFYSLGPAWGGLITMASYNRFNNNCLKDAVIVSFTCGLSSMFAGFAIFSIIGYMAHESKLPVDEVITQGPGLAFIAYPEAISKLPASPFWALCFFLTLLTLGVDCQFGTLETVTSGFIDEFPQFLKKRKMIFVILTSLSMLLVGLPFVTRGGMYLFQIVDWYAAAFSVMVIALFECIAVSYIYGIGRFYDDISLMLKKPPSKFWALFWGLITPVILFGMLVVSAVKMSPPKYGDYEFPDWAIALGWMMALASIIPLPVVAVYRLIRAEGTFMQRLKSLIKPKYEWMPQDQTLVAAYRARNEGATWRERMTIRPRGLYLGDEPMPEKVGLNSYPI